MSKQTIKMLVPKLRFPEFQDDWNALELGKCFLNVGGTALEKYVMENGTHHFISIGNYSTDGKYIDKGQRVEANEKTKSKLLNKNDLVMVLNDKTLVGDIIGSTLLIDQDDKYIYNQRSERLIVDSELIPTFAWHLLNSQVVRKEVFKRSQGGTQIYVNFPTVKAIKLAIPKEKKEQQKIADCLSSIDDLIAAHTQKHEALKAHKNGLMQQLFPAEGETVPKLRFPEFHDAGEWKIKPMEKLFTIGNGKDHKHLPDGDIPVYGSGGYMRSVNEYLYEGESACIGRKGTIDKPVFLSGKFWTVDTLFYTHSFKNCLPKFVYLIFQNMNWRSHNEAGGVPSLSKANINKIEVACPKPAEQLKIADFISSIDDLITAQAKKIESLTAHKKGLMQQLFPATDEVDA